MTLRIGWFSTGRGQGSRDLLRTVKEKIDQGALDARIEFVFCNREPGEFEQTDLFLDQVRRYQLPLLCLSSRRHRAGREDWSSREAWRLAYDREAMKRLRPFAPELSVLAGYMLVVGPEMCDAYDMVNLHPAAPGGPAGTWQEVLWQLIGTRADRSGVMMHLAIPELDQGPPVTYCTYALRGGPFDEAWKTLEGRSVEGVQAEEGVDNALFKLIRQHGLAREFPLIVSTVGVFAKGEVRIEKKRLLDRQGNPVEAYDLSEEIDEAVAGELGA